MNKKLLVTLTALVCLIAIVVTTVLSVGYMTIDFPEFNKILKPSKQSTYHLTVNASSGGTVNITEGDYQSGETVTLVATPDAGYVFSGWFMSDNTYLTTSDTYECVMTKHTELNANFAPEPTKIEGSKDKAEVLVDCSPEFSFTIHCDRPDAVEFIKSQVEIVDAYYADEEDRSAYARDFEVKELGNGEWLITPAENESYEEGATYTVVLATPPVEDGGDEGGDGGDNTDDPDVPDKPVKPDNEPKKEISFADDVVSGESEMKFSVAKPEKEEVAFNDGMVYLIDSNDSRDQVVSITEDGKIEGEAGDKPDMVVLKSSYGLREGSVFCVYDGNKNADGSIGYNPNNLYGKVTSIKKSNGNYTVVYGMPAITDIFKDFDVNKKNSVDFGKSDLVLDQALVEQIKASLFSNESFYEFVAVSQQSVVNLASKSGYDVITLSESKLADRINIAVTPTIIGSDLKADIKVEINFPLTLEGKQVALIYAVSNISEAINISTISSANLKYSSVGPVGLAYDFRAEIKITETISYDFSVVYDKGNGADLSRGFTVDTLKDECAKAFSSGKLNEYCDTKTIKNIFGAHGYNTNNAKYVKLGNLSISDDVICYDVALEFMFDVDFKGSYIASGSSEITTLVGIRSTSKGAQTYSNLKGKVNNTTSAFSGDFTVKTGVGFSIDTYISGLSKYVKTNMSGSTGSYIGVKGMMNAGYYAGHFESGVSLNFKAEYKSFDVNGKVDSTSKALPVVEFGNSHTVYGYKNQSKLNGGNYTIEFNRKEYPIFETNYLTLNVYNILNGTSSVENIDASGNKYEVKVTFADGKYLKYKDGKIIVVDNAPLYFEDSVSVSLVGNNTWGEYSNNKYTCYVPTVTLKIVYGNEQNYIESFDTPMMSHFRSLYRSYRPGDTTVLNSLFDKLFGDMVTVSERYSAIFDVVIREYLDVMFDELAKYHALEDQNAAENEFVNLEAETFQMVIDYMKGLMESKNVDTAEIRAVMDKVIESKVMYQMLINASKSDKVSSLTERFNTVPQDVKDSIRTELDKYESDNHSNEKAVNTVNAFRTVLGF